jgi:uncharacterized RDD family membrane protein YckC
LNPLATTGVVAGHADVRGRIQSTGIRGARSAAPKESHVEQVGARDQVQYAGLGWRFAAVAVDTVLVLMASSIALAVLMVAGVVDLGLAQTATFDEILSASRVAPGWLMPAEYALFFAYFTLFELRGATPGKRLFRLSVTGEDGTRPSPRAVVVRNLVRIPEMYLLYLPSGISCLANAKNKRLGDLAAKTVVVRRSAAPVGVAAAGPVRSAPGRARALATPAPPSPSASGPAAAEAPGASEALAGLKTAALAVRGAHLNYLRFAEVELAKESVGTAGSPADEAGAEPAAEAEPEYSPEYAAAWYTLADAVIAMQQAPAAAIAAATREGTTLPAICADQPDLTYLFRELEPYFTAGSDDQVHDAYMSVARGETTA